VPDRVESDPSEIARRRISKFQSGQTMGRFMNRDGKQHDHDLNHDLKSWSGSSGFSPFWQGKFRLALLSGLLAAFCRSWAAASSKERIVLKAFSEQRMIKKGFCPFRL